MTKHSSAGFNGITPETYEGWAGLAQQVNEINDKISGLYGEINNVNVALTSGEVQNDKLAEFVITQIQGMATDLGADRERITNNIPYELIGRLSLDVSRLVNEARFKEMQVLDDAEKLADLAPSVAGVEMEYALGLVEGDRSPETDELMQAENAINKLFEATGEVWPMPYNSQSPDASPANIDESDNNHRDAYVVNITQDHSSTDRSPSHGPSIEPQLNAGEKLAEILLDSPKKSFTYEELARTIYGGLGISAEQMNSRVRLLIFNYYKPKEDTPAPLHRILEAAGYMLIKGMREIEGERSRVVVRLSKVEPSDGLSSDVSL